MSSSRERIYNFIHQWLVPALHLFLWLASYVFLDEYVLDKYLVHESESWYPLLKILPVCFMFFVGFIISLIDLFFANPNTAVSILVFIPFSVVFALITTIAILLFLFLPTPEAEKGKYIVAIFTVSAGARFMEVWLQNNLSKFNKPYRPLLNEAEYERRYTYNNK